MKKCVVCLTIEVILLNWNSASPLSLTYSSCSSCLSLFLLLLSHVRLFWDLMNCSPLGSSVHGILQARILEWVAIPFSGLSTWFRDQTWVSCIADRFFTIWAMREHPLWKSQVRDYLLQESPGPARNLLPQELPSTRNYLLQESPGPPARPVEDAQCSSSITSCSVRT